MDRTKLGALNYRHHITRSRRSRRKGEEVKDNKPSLAHHEVP